MPDLIEKAYRIARQRYASVGINTDRALETLKKIRLSINCWQGDDVQGFEPHHGISWRGGIQVTGSHPERARNAVELRQDIEQAMAMIPGRHRVNLHAMYGEFRRKKADRDAIEPAHFRNWADWAEDKKFGIDFNATLFKHPNADTGFTLSSKDRSIRDFWIEHVRRSRRIAAFFGTRQHNPCIHNLWIPDGMKDNCVDRSGHREILKKSLDEIYETEYSTRFLKDSVEPKLFGIGSESYTVGSYDFYLGYALENGLMPCLDLGHFHPTESVADKISSLLIFSGELLLHLSRGVRWDSDHVPLFDDNVREVMTEVKRCRALGRVHLALDFFDASISRVGAWIIGARAVQKAMLCALLEPTAALIEREKKGDYSGRLYVLESLKTMPFGSVWDYHCLANDVPPDGRLAI
jgi:L-rhamnose isomerase